MVVPTDRLTVEYSIDRETIHVGDPVDLVVTAYFPTNGVLELPEIGREKDIVLLNRNWNREPREDGLIKSETLFTLTSFRLGDHVVSTNTISFTVRGSPLCSWCKPAATAAMTQSLRPANSKPPLLGW